MSAPAGPVRPPLRVNQEGATPRCPGSGDFITEYAQYADVLEAPREVHEAVAITLLAAVLNPRVSIQHGALTHTLDLWMLLLSGSGLGRNTLLGLMYPVLDEAGLGSLVRGAALGSGSAFYQDLALNAAGLFIWPEMSHALKTLSQSNFAGVKVWLTDRFDNPRVPDAVRYRVTGNLTDTPSIVFETAPRVNILATSSDDWFISSLTHEDSTGGFIPRWLIVRVAKSGRVIPKPEAPDPRLVGPLAERLRRASALKGVADQTGIEDIYDGWYRQALIRFEQQPNTALAMPFFNRLRALVLKLAVVFEVSMSNSICVSPEAMHRAIAWAARYEAKVFELLPTGMTAEGFAVDRIEQKIRDAGIAGCTQSELTRAFQGVKSKDNADRLKTLLQAGRIAAFKRMQTGGRSAAVFVHADFREQHAKEYPNDTPR